jgi:hypothetical protein
MPINLPIPSSIFSLVSVGVNDSSSGTSGSNESINTNSAVASNLIISGVVVDEEKKPMVGVNITITQTPGINTEYNGVIGPIADNVVTNDKGEWSIIYPRTQIDLKSVNIIFFRQGYKTDNISNPQITTQYPSTISPLEVIKISTPEVEPPYEYRVGNEIFKSSDQNVAKTKATDYALKVSDPKYRGASIINIKKTLFKAPKPEEIIQPLTQPIIDEVNKLERIQDEEKNKQELPASAKLAVRVSIQKEKAKKKLIPFIIKLLIPFGVAVVQAVLAKASLDKIKDQILCPKQDEILKLINKRNKLVKQINNLYKAVTTMSKILIGANIAITTIQLGILAVTVIPLPMPPALPVGAGVLQDQLKKARIVVNIMTLTLAAFGAVLGIILRLLNSLDFLLRECAQSQNVPFEKINDELNLFVNESTGVSNVTAIESTNNTYKGFTLELILDPLSDNKYPKRFAQALTRNGIPVLKTDSSFASDPQVLLDQLKFIIDSNPDLNAG